MKEHSDNRVKPVKDAEANIMIWKRGAAIVHDKWVLQGRSRILHWQRWSFELHTKTMERLGM